MAKTFVVPPGGSLMWNPPPVLLAFLLTALSLIPGTGCNQDDQEDSPPLQESVETGPTLRDHLNDLHDLGAEAEPFEFEQFIENGTRVRLYPEHVTLSGTIEPDIMVSIREIPDCILELDGLRVSKAGLDALKGMKNLIGLSIFGCPVGDDDIIALETLTNLRLIKLKRTLITDHGLETISKLNQLQILYLGGEAISNAGIARLAGLTDLVALQLTGTRLSDQGIGTVLKFQEMRYLGLDKTKLSDTGGAKLGELKQLTYLDLRMTDVGKQTTSALASCEKLIRLNLAETSADDEAIEPLQNAKQLKLIDLRNTQVTLAAIQELQKSLPECKVEVGR